MCSKNALWGEKIGKGEEEEREIQRVPPSARLLGSQSSRSAVHATHGASHDVQSAPKSAALAASRAVDRDSAAGDAASVCRGGGLRVRISPPWHRREASRGDACGFDRGRACAPGSPTVFGEAGEEKTGGGCCG